VSLPIWLLDIDGVINAATLRPPTYVWPADTWIQTKVIGLRIMAAQPVLDFIREVHEQGRAEIRWHSTWQDDAPKLGAELGLPAFPVADAPEYDQRLKQRAFGLDGWWKRPAAERVLAEGRPLVWTDDDITWSLGRRGQDEIRQLGPALLIAPDDRTGLTPKHLRHIADFLDLHPAAMGADHLGHPLTPMPATHRAALAGVDWPTPGQETTR